jgi:hypothetical protein
MTLPNIDVPLNYNHVTERIIVGSRPRTAEDWQELLKLGVSHVLNVCDVPDPMPIPPGIWYTHNPALDDGKPKPADWFRRSIHFALNGVAADGAKWNPVGGHVGCLDVAGYILYVHCFDGYDRGPSTVYAIMRAFGLTRLQAIGLIKAARPLALPGVEIPGTPAHTYVASADAAVAAGW